LTELTASGDLVIKSRHSGITEDLLRVEQALVDDLMQSLLATLSGRYQAAIEHTKLALATSLRPDVLATVRDAFLSGNDVEALALLAHELGLVKIASPHPEYRPLQVGDPVVVVAYGRIRSLAAVVNIDDATRCRAPYVVGLFSGGLGYDGPNWGPGADASDYRSFDAMADEVRYCEVPVHLEERARKDDEEDPRPP
jgi:hypothetical protein